MQSPSWLKSLNKPLRFYLLFYFIQTSQETDETEEGKKKKEKDHT